MTIKIAVGKKNHKNMAVKARIWLFLRLFVSFLYAFAAYYLL